jgi:hypothetical protein
MSSDAKVYAEQLKTRMKYTSQGPSFNSYPKISINLSKYSISFFNKTYHLFSEYSAMLQNFGSILLLWNTKT